MGNKVDIPVVMKIKPELALSNEIITEILSLAVTAKVLYRSAYRLQITLLTNDWFELGVALLTNPKPNLAFLMEYTSDPFRVTATFFSTKNIGVQHVTQAMQTLKSNFEPTQY